MILAFNFTSPVGPCVLAFICLSKVVLEVSLNMASTGQNARCLL
jgi:hypothetical protein